MHEMPATKATLRARLARRAIRQRDERRRDRERIHHRGQRDEGEERDFVQRHGCDYVRGKGAVSPQRHRGHERRPLLRDPRVSAVKRLSDFDRAIDIDVDVPDQALARPPGDRGHRGAVVRDLLAIARDALLGWLSALVIDDEIVVAFADEAVDAAFAVRRQERNFAAEESRRS